VSNPNTPETALFRYISACHLRKASALLHLPHQNLHEIPSVSGRRILKVQIFDVQGKNTGNTLCISEYFNTAKVKICLLKSMFGSFTFG